MAKAKAKKKPGKKPIKLKKKRQVSEDTRQRRKYKRGGRVEAYTFGEAQSKKGFPW